DLHRHGERGLQRDQGRTYPVKVLALRADSGGCAFYRMYEPARVVQALDSTVQVDVRADLDVEATRDPVTKLVTVSEVKEDVDLIIFQRPLSQAMYAAIVQAKKQGIATIVEMDDDLERVHPQNVAWTRMQPKYSPTSNYEW